MLPTSSTADLEDDALLEAFETLAIPPAALRHREHVRVAFAMFRIEGDFGEGAVRFRRALRRFATAAGATAKYHETLTWAFLALIHERMYADPCATSQELLARHPDLLDGALARCYDLAEITASPLARAVFVLPTRG
jgi:hypothetical protein